jgi:putative sigma-54 modulation protein
MRLELTGRHVTITPAVRKAVEQHLTRLSRVLNDSMHSAQAVITKEKSRYRVEMTVHARGEHFLHAAVTGRDAATALTAAAEKIERQAQKLKSKWTERKRQGISPAKAASAAPRPGRARGVFGNGAEGSAEAEPRAVRIIRARRYDVKPMSVDEAALEVGDGRDAFIVFRNATTDTINVLFRRTDGHLGLIEPEA